MWIPNCFGRGIVIKSLPYIQSSFFVFFFTPKTRSNLHSPIDFFNIFQVSSSIRILHHVLISLLPNCTRVHATPINLEEEEEPSTNKMNSNRIQRKYDSRTSTKKKGAIKKRRRRVRTSSNRRVNLVSSSYFNPCFVSFLHRDFVSVSINSLSLDAIRDIIIEFVVMRLCIEDLRQEWRAWIYERREAPFLRSWPRMETPFMTIHIPSLG